jgi:hypothetical protein
VTPPDRSPASGPTLADVEARLDMPLREAMETQRAVRRLLPDPVDDAIVLRCLELATRAPTGSYVDRNRVDRSSEESYDPRREGELWDAAERLTTT